jgi:hypothetical protein
MALKQVKDLTAKAAKADERTDGFKEKNKELE